MKCPTGSGKNWKLWGLHVLLFWCHFINCLQSCKTFYSPPSFSCIVSTRFFLLFEVSLILLDQLLAFGTNFPREYKCCQTIQCKFWEKYIKKNVTYCSPASLLWLVFSPRTQLHNELLSSLLLHVRLRIGLVKGRHFIDTSLFPFPFPQPRVLAWMTHRKLRDKRHLFFFFLFERKKRVIFFFFLFERKKRVISLSRV